MHYACDAVGATLASPNDQNTVGATLASPNDRNTVGAMLASPNDQNTVGATLASPSDQGTVGAMLASPQREWIIRMPYNPVIHQRRSIRLKGYDYSQAGAYFVTVVVQARENLFGEILNGEMQLNAAGEIVLQTWNDLPARFPSIELDAFVIMPNHVHGIIVIGHDTIGATLDTGAVGATFALPNDQGTVGATLASPNDQDAVGAMLASPNDQGTVGATLASPNDEGAASSAPTDHAPTLGRIMRAFKSISAINVNRELERKGQPLWQRNYYEHIIRNEKDLNRIREYILNNPLNWESDSENPRH